MNHKIFARLFSLMTVFLLAFVATSCVKESPKPNWDFVAIVPTSVVLTQGGEISELAVHYGGQPVDLTECKFTNENDQVAVINEKYHIVPVGVGTTKITVVYKEFTSSVTISVVAPKKKP